ncbi:MAG TPA: sensor histidine kinase KdpD [Stellaceae bacterium]|nr:sensor histidine kinase KdpD [Stellaceae bacterium]
MTDQDQGQRDGRPSPDALLAEAETERRGWFKIFLGAAPGVGKTYEMLRNAHAKLADGVDVVVGIVETHGRDETSALTDGLDIIPRLKIEYKGRVIEEMDLDALLARRPKLVLVDELAHTNAPGSRHPKRYLDVEELLAAGIDVYSTVNIQHLESLNDVVAQITRIRVRETIPDRVLDLANEIEVIDLTPEALIKRLHEGKVYVRDQAQRALKHYFSPGNLTALRELALRRTAQRVDDQMLSYMQAHAIEGPWAAGERILVCISDDPGSAGRIRYARRMADRLRAKWTALYVEGPRHYLLSEKQRDKLAEQMRLAERLGAEAITISGRDLAEEILGFARAQNVTHIVIGKAERSRWFVLVRGSIVHKLIRHSGNISVHVIAGDEAAEPAEGKSRIVPITAGLRSAVDPVAYAASTVMVALATGACLLLDRVVTLPNLSLVFLLAVLSSAVRYGLWPSLFSSLLSVVAYNFFFLPPLYTFVIADPANFVALLFFLLVALITSNLTAVTQRQARTAADRNRKTEEMYAFSRKVAAIRSLDDLLWTVTYQIAVMLKVDVVVLLADADGLAIRGSYPPEDELGSADMAAAQWSWSNNHPAGRGSDTLPGGKRLFLPLQTGQGAIGVVGVDRTAPELLSPDERRLLDALLDQAAVAIERVRLAEDVDQVRLQAETERLRNALLTSVSHDLRTPLASIIGALTSLKTYGDLFDKPSRDELITTAQDEAERLNRFVGNLLDMTRLESGGIMPKADPVDVGEVFGTVLRRTAGLLVHHQVELAIAEDLPMVAVDSVLLEQVLFNLLDNAAKYAPPETKVEVRAEAANATMSIEIIDEGPGIPAEALDAIFSKFTRLQQGDNRRAGTGLGLAICRGFVEAMGGTISAQNRLDRSGALFRIKLPTAPATARTPAELVDGA